MPAYDFKCKDCEETFVVVLTMSEYDEKKDEVVCEKCGSNNVKRLFSPTPHRWVHPDEKKLGKHINDVI